MPSFGKASRAHRATCDPRLQRVLDRVIRTFDCSVIWGHRGRAAQEEAFAGGFSTKHWPNSKHNRLPSPAMDVTPYPTDWNDRERFTLLAGFILATADQIAREDAQLSGLSAPTWTLRWGGDWDRDTDLADNKWDDLAHYEIVELTPAVAARAAA